METKKFLFPILIIFLLFFAFSFGFFLGSKRVKTVEKEVVRVLEPKKSKLVEKRYYYITGIVKEIDYEKKIVTLTADGDEMKIFISADKVRSYARRHVGLNQTGPSQVTFYDILVGDKLSTFVEEKENGELIGISANLHWQ
jgi:hypothetical protein